MHTKATHRYPLFNPSSTNRTDVSLQYTHGTVCRLYLYVKCRHKKCPTENGRALTSTVLEKFERHKIMLSHLNNQIN